MYEEKKIRTLYEPRSGSYKSVRSCFFLLYSSIK